MPTRRSLLGAGFPPVLTTASSASAQEGLAASEAIAELIGRSAEANAALLRGDVGRYRALIALTRDFVLMAPFGGTPSRGADIGDETWDGMSRFFRHGTLRQELVQAYGSTDLIVLVVIEHGHGEVGGLPAQDWPLRVTKVFRHEGGEWRLAHRHADPLVHGVSLQQAAARAAGRA